MYRAGAGRVAAGLPTQSTWERVRLIGIDTPERAQPWGRQATAALERRLRQGTEVTLQPITQDEYDRLVAVVYLDDENLNAWMVQQGHAWAYRR